MDSERVRVTLAPTGDSRVDVAIQPLASLADTDLAERPAVLAGVHDRLREILGELGDPGRPGPPAPAPARAGEPGRRGEQAELSGAFRPAGPQPRPGQPQPRQAQPGRPHV